MIIFGDFAKFPKALVAYSVSEDPNAVGKLPSVGHPGIWTLWTHRNGDKIVARASCTISPCKIPDPTLLRYPSCKGTAQEYPDIAGSCWWWCQLRHGLAPDNVHGETGSSVGAGNFPVPAVPAIAGA